MVLRHSAELRVAIWCGEGRGEKGKGRQALQQRGLLVGLPGCTVTGELILGTRLLSGGSQSLDLGPKDSSQARS